jgi:hypothetical protein
MIAIAVNPHAGCHDGVAVADIEFQISVADEKIRLFVIFQINHFIGVGGHNALPNVPCSFMIGMVMMGLIKANPAFSGKEFS